MGLDPKEPFPKRARLKDFDYTGTYAYFITILTRDRGTYFTETDVVDVSIEILQEVARSKRFKILTYCFMPDHLHLLVVGESENSNLKKFISLFKQKSGYWYKMNFDKELWHVSYHDHVLRREENLETVAMYILGNPVRKGLVSDYKEYRFSRCFW